MENAKRKVGWIDVETSGLDGGHPGVLLLEVALVVTDSDLEELGRESVVIAWTPEEIAAAKWDPIAREMHETNGLLEEVAGPTALRVPEAERRILRTLHRYAGVDLTTSAENPTHGAESDGAPLWGGCSPWLDRTILRRVMPRFYERIHYRTIDATSLKLASELWCGESTHRSHRPHRALPDALSAVALASRTRRIFLHREATSPTTS